MLADLDMIFTTLILNNDVVARGFTFTQVFNNELSHIFFYLLFVSLTPVAYISQTVVTESLKSHNAYIVIIYLGSVAFLLTNSTLYFILFYELLIFPIFLVLSNYGHYYSSVQASFFILIWALLGSFFLFVGVIILSYFGVSNLDAGATIDADKSLLALFCILLGFSVKVPLWPFHFWISSAHAEGPTNMSIFLSGVLVKLSVYGILNILNLFFLNTFISLFFFLALVGVVEATLNMLVQIDSNVVVAFSTTVQMNFILFLIFSSVSTTTSVINFGLVNHMLTASLLFFLTDTILVSFNTSEFFVLSGINNYIPVLSFFLVVSLINQINFPGFLGFLYDIFFLTKFLANAPISSFFLFFFLFVVEHLYIFFFFCNIVFGVSNNFNHIVFKDLSYVELFLFGYLLQISVFFGIFPINFFII